MNSPAPNIPGADVDGDDDNDDEDDNDDDHPGVHRRGRQRIGGEAFAPAGGCRGTVQHEAGESQYLSLLHRVVDDKTRWNHSLSLHGYSPRDSFGTPGENESSSDGTPACRPSSATFYASEHARKSSELLNLLKVIDVDLRAFNKPYLCGDWFSLADVHILLMMERIVVELSVCRNFWIPGSLRDLLYWYGAIMDRPAMCAATSDQEADSLSTYCYEEVARGMYLLS